MEREGLEAGIGTDVEAPEGECMKDAQNADPCGPSTWAKKSVQWQLMQKSLI